MDEVSNYYAKPYQFIDGEKAANYLLNRVFAYSLQNGPHDALTIYYGPSAGGSTHTGPLYGGSSNGAPRAEAGQGRPMRHPRCCGHRAGECRFEAVVRE